MRRAATSLLRITAALLAVILCVAPLTGCAPAPSDSTSDSDSTGQQTAEDAGGVSLAEAMAAMNRPIAEDLAGQLSAVSWSGLIDGRITLCGRGLTNAATGQAPYLLATLDAETEKYTCQTLTLPAPPADRPGLLAAWGTPADAVHGEEYDTIVRSLAGVISTEQGLVAVLDDTLLHTSPEQEFDQVTERDLTLCALTEDGALQPLARLQLPEDLAPGSAVENLFLGGDATLWLTVCDYAQPSAALLGFSLADGSLQKTLPLPEGATPGTVAPLADGRLLLSASLSEGPQQNVTYGFLLAEGLDGTPRWQQQTLPPLLTGLSALPAFVPAVDGDGGTLLVNTGDALVRWDPAGESAEELLRWMQLSVDPFQLSAAFGLSDDRCLVCTREDAVDFDTPYRLRVLTPLDPAALAGRTVLTMATTPYGGQPDAAQQVINTFNAKSTEYYIQTVDWSLRSLDEGILNRELPDIVMISSVKPSVLNKGVFIDLYPLLDADPALSREDFVPNILRAAEVDGRLPTITPAYSLNGLVAASADVGEEPGWTLDDLYRLCEQNPTPFHELGRTWILRRIVQNSENWFMNTETGQAHFDTPEYIRLLEFCATQPDSPYLHWPKEPLDLNNPFAGGSSLLLDYGLSNWGSVNMPRFIFDGAYTQIGYPTPDGTTNGFCVEPKLQLAISYTCQEPEAAWQVVREFLLPAFQDRIGVEATLGYIGFPLRQDSLLAGAATAQTIENPSTGWNYFTEEDWRTAQEFMQDPLSRQDADEILEVIEGTTTMRNNDFALYSILEEEAQDFYNGIRSAEEAAAITQQRVQLYLDEQK